MKNSTASKLSLVDQGKGEPTLLFLHYFSGAAASWQWVMAELQDSFRCIALDIPGFGEASPLEKPTLENYSQFIHEAVSHLKLDRFVLVGHSMGGKMALKAAADATGEGLEHVILIAPSPATQEPMPDEERDRLLTDHHQQETAQTTVESASQASLSESQRAIAIKTHVEAEDKTWRWWLLEGMNHSIADQMSSVEVPVTVIASPDDPVIPFDTLQTDVIDLLPQSTLVKLSGVGHLSPLEAPGAIAQNICQILNPPN